MFEKQIKISRTDLYERVWTTPLRTLAKEFGLSDVGLAKLCRRHGIPLPGRGYWVRMQFGKKQERTALAPIAAWVGRYAGAVNPFTRLERMEQHFLDPKKLL